MAAVAKLPDNARLVMLAEAGGVGKTRLALRVASTASQLHDERATAKSR
jgi:predicted ATPase